MAESLLVKAIEKTVHQRGGWIFKTHGTGAGRRGIPDLVGSYRGRALALEVKQPGRVSTTTRLQRHELDRASKAGAAAQVVTTTHEVGRILDEIDKDVER